MVMRHMKVVDVLVGATARLLLWAQVLLWALRPDHAMKDLEMAVNTLAIARTLRSFAAAIYHVFDKSSSRNVTEKLLCTLGNVIMVSSLWKMIIFLMSTMTSCLCLPEGTIETELQTSFPRIVQIHKHRNV